jgi:voltage-gated potassium channel
VAVTGRRGAAAEGGDSDSGDAANLTFSARRLLLGLAAVMAAFYAAPVGELPSGAGIAFSVLGLLGGVSLLGWMIIRQVRRIERTGPDDHAVRIEGLVLLLFVVVPMFALGYLALQESDSSQFVGLATKTDALYFALSTLGTVGFGDVHAAGQLARGLVSLQIAFDLVFVAALVAMVTGQIRERAASRRAPPRPPGAGELGGEGG